MSAIMIYSTLVASGLIGIMFLFRKHLARHIVNDEESLPPEEDDFICIYYGKDKGGASTYARYLNKHD